MVQRIRLSRRKGWRKPEGAIVVSRPGKWGNPFTVTGAIEAGYADDTQGGREVAVEAFRDWLHGDTWAAGSGPEWDKRRFRFLAELSELAGHDLACWCPLPAPGEPDVCHGAVLLVLANRPEVHA